MDVNLLSLSPVQEDVNKEVKEDINTMANGETHWGLI